jgi:uncharacterized protein YyaL (SSP411 family)
MTFETKDKSKNTADGNNISQTLTSLKWYSWGEEAFAKAQKENKPILLSIAGAWCHWCHIMDDRTYSDQQVIGEINKNFVPVRVDTDQRPDINARYNLGGWPTTAFLTPAGDVIGGGTYIPPQEMLEMIRGTLRSYRQGFAEPDFAVPDDADEELLAKGDVEFATQGGPLPEMETKKRAVGKETETFADLIGFTADQILESYDARYGGFGSFPKFPMFEALELAQIACLYQEKDPQWENIFTHTLRAMFNGGVYDAVEGGFFRYSTTRDWSVPHFEKMLEDNARLLQLLLTTYKFTGDEFFAGAARDVLRYLENNLYLPETGGWAGSQDAEEEYYALPLGERQKRSKPAIDRNIYVNWNALLVRSLFQAAVVLAESKWYDHAMMTLNLLRQRCYQPGNGMAHYLSKEDANAHVWGLLEDQACMGLALTAAYQHSGDPDWLDFSRELAEYCLETLSMARGALCDRPLRDQELGRMALPHFDLRQNSLCARWFTELSLLTGEEAYLEKASDLVQAFMGEYRRHSLFSAALSLAAFGIRERGAKIDVVGNTDDPALLNLHSAALSAFVPPKVVRLLSPAQVRSWGYDEYAQAEQATAFVCMGMHCFEPAKDPAELAQIVEKMVKERRAHVLFTVKQSERIR